MSWLFKKKKNKKQTPSNFSINIYGTVTSNKPISDKTKNYINSLVNDKKSINKSHWYINDNAELVWDEDHNFVAYEKWLEFIIEILKSDGHILNGTYFIRRDDIDLRYIVKVQNNKIIINK